MNSSFFHKFLLVLAACISLSLGTTGCVAEEVYGPPVAASAVYTNTVEYCDDMGCRYVTAPFYYTTDGSVVYWDSHFGYWIGPGGYWGGGVWHRGYFGGYHGYYGHGLYHSFSSHPGGWRGGSGYHGGGYMGSGRGGSGFHGGHGGHR